MQKNGSIFGFVYIFPFILNTRNRVKVFCQYKRRWLHSKWEGCAHSQQVASQFIAQGRVLAHAFSFCAHRERSTIEYGFRNGHSTSKKWVTEYFLSFFSCKSLVYFYRVICTMSHIDSFSALFLFVTLLVGQFIAKSS